MSSAVFCFFFFFYWNKGLWELMMFMWLCHHIEVTIIWHLGNRDAGLWNIVANNEHFESSEDIEGDKCSIQKVCTNIP